MPNFVNDILDIDTQVYDDAIKTVCGSFAGDKRVKYIGLYGHINDPGISDLDMVFVTEKGHCSSIANDFEQLKNNIAYGKFLFWHNPVIAGEDQLELMKIFHSFIGLKSLYGNSLNSLPKQNNYESLIHAIVWTSHTRCYCSNILRTSDAIAMRYALLAIKCCYISTASYLRFLNCEQQADKQLETAKTVRSDFKNLTDTETQTKFLTEAAKAADKQLCETEKLLQNYLQLHYPQLPFICSPASTNGDNNHAPPFYKSMHELINRHILKTKLTTDGLPADMATAILQWRAAARQAYLNVDNFRHMGGYYLIGEHLPEKFSLAHLSARLTGKIIQLTGRYKKC